MLERTAGLGGEAVRRDGRRLRLEMRSRCSILYHYCWQSITSLRCVISGGGIDVEGLLASLV